MKGIVLAGGTGSRMYPLTSVVNKHLLPVYDKPLIYYPISTLMIAGIRDIAIICRHQDMPLYKELLGDGDRLGVSFSYLPQEKASGIAEAFIIGEDFIGKDPCALILGDNIFFGHGLRSLLQRATSELDGGAVFAYWVRNPSDFGVVTFDEHDKPATIVEKPKDSVSHFAIPGLYFYDSSVVQIAKSLTPSKRGELEITDVNQEYLNNQKLKVYRFNRSFFWIDAGSPSNILSAGQYLETIEQRQGLKLACLEEIAYHAGWIDEETVKYSAKLYKNSTYGDYLSMILNAYPNKDLESDTYTRVA